ncbi:UNVERIFIED_CONTAM: Retrovirus-related Pol polyprotein from transposon RE1 [Sesamum calycinum]|uniref:Retrovirus-related Pol polyprotein from transposon RE1 n=1 Tax=Sesamum calycinum TaxID=2727403 RepID=A0AAW2QJG6_9LAMI
MGSSLNYLNEVKHYLDRLFTIKDHGFAKYFLGLDFARSPQGTCITPSTYLGDIITDCGLEDARPVSTPLPPNIKLDTKSGSLFSSPDCYHHLVGRLLYLGFSRPNISFVVQQLSQFLQLPRQAHWDAVLHLLWYLKGSLHLGLFFLASNTLKLCAYSDSDWASCPVTWRSITGFCVFLSGALISWKTKKQATVSRSSSKAKYRSDGITICQLLWISYLLT